MKENKRVVPHKNISRKAPALVTLIFILFIREFNMLLFTWSTILVGVIGSLLLTMWAIFFYDVVKYKEIPTDPFPKTPEKK